MPDAYALLAAARLARFANDDGDSVDRVSLPTRARHADGGGDKGEGNLRRGGESGVGANTRDHKDPDSLRMKARLLACPWPEAAQICARPWQPLESCGTGTYTALGLHAAGLQWLVARHSSGC